MRGLGPDKSPNIAYNLANAELGLWELSVKQNDLAYAWEHDRTHLRGARATFDRIGADESAPRELRLKALTNAGNAYDVVGRPLDALDRYGHALAIDPNYGMALGNRGLTLLYSAPYMGVHRAAILREAGDWLDAAIANEASVVAGGGVKAFRDFEQARTKVPRVKARVGTKAQRWCDDYLRWCLQYDFFLHVSHGCLDEDTAELDPLFFQRVVTSVDEQGQQRMNALVDAFNSVKQDYVAARYLAWLAIGPDSPIREHTAAMTERVRFLDSLTYARWGTRTGMAVQALAAATNVLDKVASTVHVYLATSRRVNQV
jgi:tetratricopeptide (TPR) repeat protein